MMCLLFLTAQLGGSFVLWPAGCIEVLMHTDIFQHPQGTVQCKTCCQQRPVLG